MSPRRNAGLLLYERRPAGGIELLLTHPGGPTWAKRDDGPGPRRRARDLDVAEHEAAAGLDALMAAVPVLTGRAGRTEVGVALGRLLKGDRDAERGPRVPGSITPRWRGWWWTSLHWQHR